MKKEHIVTSVDAFLIAQGIEEHLMTIGVLNVPPFHVALTGSCLYNGGSNKDVDLIVYPHNLILPSVKTIVSVLKSCGVTFDSEKIAQVNGNPYSQGTTVLIGKIEFLPTKFVRIDFILTNKNV